MTTTLRNPENSRPLRSVLMVCTGNVCRSPYAHLLLKNRLPHLEVASAGVFALEGASMERQMAGQLAERGVTAKGFRARQLSAEDLDVDVILVMSRRQRSALLEEFPSAARRTALLGAVDSLSQLLAPGSPVTVEHITRWSRLPTPAERDVPDPYRQPLEVAQGTARTLDLHLEQLVQILTAGAVDPSTGTAG